jgi:hypothetical protein
MRSGRFAILATVLLGLGLFTARWAAGATATNVTVAGTGTNGNPARSAAEAWGLIPQCDVSPGIGAFVPYSKEEHCLPDNATCNAFGGGLTRSELVGYSTTCDWSQVNLSSVPIQMGGGLTAFGDHTAACNANGCYVGEIVKSGSAPSFTSSFLGIARATLSSLTAFAPSMAEFVTAVGPATPAGGGTDGPMLAAEPTSNTLWGVAYEQDTLGHHNVRTYLWPSCTGATGSATCPAPVTTAKLVSDATNANFRQHASIAINPCTHNALVAYVSASTLLLDVHSKNNAAVTATATLAQGLRWDRNNGCPASFGNIRVCPGCGGASQQCLATEIKPSIVTDLEPSTGRCFAYVALSSSYLGSDSHYWMKANMYKIDLGTAAVPRETTTSPPLPAGSWISTQASFTWNHFAAVASVSRSSNSIGFFWYSDNTGPCQAYFEGQVSSVGFSNLGGTVPLSGPQNTHFPLMMFRHIRGFGDYITGGELRLNSDLLVTYAHPIIVSTFTGETPMVCNGASWSKEIVMSRVQP